MRKPQPQSSNTVITGVQEVQKYDFGPSKKICFDVLYMGAYRIQWHR